MSIEATIFNTLKGLVANRVYPDVAPEGASRPYITYQQTGGQAINFVDGANPGKRNARIQINVWADSRSAASGMQKQAEDALRAVSQSTILGAAVATFEPETKLYGTRQDFSFWF
jgi:hypothetical protein